MQHKCQIEGYAFRLRPASIDDAGFIVALRKDQQYLHEGAQTLEEQRTWMKNQFARPDDHYFIIEARSNHQPQGALRIIVHPETARAELNSWVVSPGSLAATESLLLTFRMAFTVLGAAAISMAAINPSVKPLYKFTGARITKKMSYVIRNKKYDGEILELSASDWQKSSNMLEELSMRVARKIN